MAVRCLTSPCQSVSDSDEMLQTFRGPCMQCNAYISNTDVNLSHSVHSNSIHPVSMMVSLRLGRSYLRPPGQCSSHSSRTELRLLVSAHHMVGKRLMHCLNPLLGVLSVQPMNHKYALGSTTKIQTPSGPVNAIRGSQGHWGQSTPSGSQRHQGQPRPLGAVNAISLGSQRHHICLRLP